jgi:hypothetical protein
MRAGKAGSRSVDQLEINTLPGDILHQLRNSPWVLKAEETLIVPRYFQRGLKDVTAKSLRKFDVGRFDSCNSLIINTSILARGVVLDFLRSHLETVVGFLNPSLILNCSLLRQPLKSLKIPELI